MSDGRGLYLLVRTSGSKLWRQKYRFAGKEKLLAIGPYPEVSITQARNARDNALQLLREGIDPSAERQERKARARLEAIDTFEQIARKWHATRAELLTKRYADALLARLQNDAFPAFGSKPMRQITPRMVLDMIRKIEERGARDVAHRIRNHVSDVFVYGIAEGVAESDPAAIIKKALLPLNGRRRAAITDLPAAQALLRTLEARSGVHWSTLLATRLLALTAARPGVVRLAEKSEFEGLDGPAPIWRIPAAKMKLTRAEKNDITREFIIPLSPEAAAVAAAAISESFACRSPLGRSWLFHGPGGFKKPISDSTLSKLYREAGYTGVHVPHGWRSTFSTIMNERAAEEDEERDRLIIDMMLAHAQPGVEPIYNRSLYLRRRRQLGEDWANLLMSGMIEPHLLLPEHRPWRSKSGEAAHERRSDRKSNGGDKRSRPGRGSRKLLASNL